MTRNPFFRVVVLTGGFVAAFGMIRPSWLVTGVPPNQFWTLKYSRPSEYDIALIGCSRIIHGLSPQAMERKLPGYRVINFAFGGLGYSDGYLKAARGLLDPRSEKKTIVMGIQPTNFFPHWSEKNDFTTQAKTGPFQRWLTLRFGGVANFFRPYDVWEIRQRIGGDRTGLYQVYHPDGWVAARRMPEDPGAAIPKYREILAGEKMNRAIMDKVLKTVAQWTDDDIHVYGIRVPTSEGLIELENKMTGFDERSFAAAFEKAGGVWLRIPAGKYHSYDGSHLRYDSAREYSALVAEEIGKNENRLAGLRRGESVRILGNGSNGRSVRRLK